MKLLILLLFINICNGFSVREISNKVKRQLEPNFLCSIGPSPLSARAEASFRARQGVVYVDPTRPATCNGRVDTIETCFEINDNIAENFPSFDLINLRPHAGGYQLQLSLVIPINEITEDENSHLISLYCQNITVPSAFTVRKGDMIGFRSWNNIEIAFTFFPFEGSLRSVRLEPVLGVETVQADDLRVDSKNDSELPMFRVFIVDDGMNTGGPATPGDCPTTSTSNADNEPGGGGAGPDLNFNNIYNITYSSFVIGFIVAVIIVFVLVLTVLGMGMSMCKGGRKCLNKICCCCRKGKNKNKFKELPGMDGSTTL